MKKRSKTIMTHKTLIVIPSRLQATRLPNKPLANINGKPMIQHVWERACKANAGDVVVSCAEQEIADVIEKAGGKAVLSDPTLPSGTDRVHAAWRKVDPDATIYDSIVNLQGDLPTIDPKIINKTVAALHATPKADILTPVTKIIDMSELSTPSVVKVATGNFHNTIAKALYFSRNCIPYNAKQYYHHIGLYVLRPKALAQFVKLPISNLEKEEKLEQLRALEAGHSIHVVCVDTDTPFGVDTADDLEKARKILGHYS